MNIRDELQKKIDIVNSRLSEMYDGGYEKLQAVKIGKEQLRKILGEDEQRMYYPDASELTDKQVERVSLAADKFINSKWTSKEGRAEIFDKRLSTFIERSGLSKEDALKAYDIFSADVYHQMIEKNLLTSKQQIDLIRRHKNLEPRDFEQAISSLVSQSSLNRNQSWKFIESILNLKED